MNTGFTSDVDPFFLGLNHGVDPFLAGHVTDVDRTARFLREEDGTLNGFHFGEDRAAVNVSGQSEPPLALAISPSRSVTAAFSA